MEQEKRELVIIGAGPAGLSAAIYGKRAGLDVLVLEKGAAGGQINLTDSIENYPGILSATGFELAELFKKHAEKFNPEIRRISKCKIEIRDGKKFILTKKGKTEIEIEATAIIIATGAHYKRLGCEGEAEHIGQGVSFCAVCDGAFYKGLEIAVIGGGNTAVEEADYLTNFAAKVYLIHRRDEFRAVKIAVDRALANPKIVPVYNSVVTKIEGAEGVEKIIIKNVKTNELSELKISGVFMFVGQEPDDECIRGLVEAEAGGWVKTDEKMQTSIKGIYAAGDIRSKFLRQVITATSDGAIAAMAASEYIRETK